MVRICCIICRTCSLLDMMSKSFLTSSLEGASGAIETVVCAQTLADIQATQRHITSFNFIEFPPFANDLDLPVIIQGLESQEPRRSPKFFFNPQQLVVLGNAVRTRCRSRLDLSRSRGHGQIRNERIFSFAGPVRNHRGISVPSRQVDGVERFADRADLVDLDQNRIAHSLVDSFLQKLDIRYENIV